MSITVHVSPGPRAKVGPLSLTNDTPFQEAELRKRLRLKPGQLITSQRLEGSAERVRTWLVSRNYLGARVTLERGAYDPGANAVPMQVRLSSGFALQVRVEGWKFSGSALRKLLPIYQEGAVDEDLLQEGRRNLRDAVQREGYFDVEVSYMASQPSETPSGSNAPPPKSLGPEVITYSVERGARHRVAGYLVDGNRYFAQRADPQPVADPTGGIRLARALQLRAAGCRRCLHHRPVSGQRLFAGACDQRCVDDYLGHRGNIFVRFHVTEGLQTRIAQFQIDGNRAFTTEMLNAVIGSAPGQPFSDFNVAGDRDNILALYYNKGFPDASFKATVQDIADPAGESPRVSLTYHIVEGAQQMVAQPFHQRLRAHPPQRDSARNPTQAGQAAQPGRRRRIAAAPV